MTVAEFFSKLVRPQLSDWATDEDDRRIGITRLVEYYNIGINLIAVNHPEAFNVDGINVDAPTEITTSTADQASTLPIVTRWRMPLARFILALCFGEDSESNLNLALANDHLTKAIAGV